MKKLINIVVALTLLLSLVAPFRVQTASAAASVTILDDAKAVSTTSPLRYFQLSPNYPPTLGNTYTAGSYTSGTWIYKMGDLINIKISGVTLGTSLHVEIYDVTGTGTGSYQEFVFTQDPMTIGVPTANVKNDGPYTVRVYSGSNLLAESPVFYIKYNLTEATKNVPSCIGSKIVLTGYVTRAQGYPITQPLYVWLVDPNGKAIALQYIDPAVNPAGQYYLTQTVTSTGTYRLLISDNYPTTANYDYDAMVYSSYSNTPKIQIKISPYISPIRLYKGQNGQPLLIKVEKVYVDYPYVDPEPYTGLTILDWTINNATVASYAEISPGFYRFVLDIGSVVDVRLKVTISSTLYSNQLVFNTVDLSVFNPYVDVTAPDAMPPYGEGPWTLDSVQSVYDKLPCTIGNSFEIKVGSWPIPSTLVSDWQVRTFSWNLNGEGAVDLSGGNIHGNGDTIKVLVTKSGSISVTATMVAWERVNKTCDISSTNACCHTYEKTFDICSVSSCEYNGTTITGTNVSDGNVPVSFSTTSGDLLPRYPVNLSVAVTSGQSKPQDLTCSCPDFIVTMYMVDAEGNIVPNAFTVDTWLLDPITGKPLTATGSVIWYNPQHVTGPNIPDAPIQVFGNAGSTSSGTPVALYDENGNLVTGALKYQDCPFGLQGISFNQTTVNNTIVVKVFGKSQKFDTCGQPIITYPMIAEEFNPFGVTPSVNTLNSSATITEGTVDPDEMLAGVPAIIDITDPGFSYDKGIAGWTQPSFVYYNLESGMTVTSSKTDTGYRFVFNRPFSTSGTFKIVGESYRTDYKVKETVSIEIKVLKPTFTVQLGLKDGSVIDNDGILTTGFDELIYVKAVDPRGIHDFSTDPNWTLSISAVNNSCGLPSSKVCGVVEGPGCSYGLPLRVVGYDNPNLADTPQAKLYFVSNGAKISVTTFKFVDPTVSVDPTEVPFTIPATATHLTFTVKDAHGHGAPNISVSLLSGNSSGADGYTWTATGALTDKDGHADWAFVPPFSGKYSVTATVTLPSNLQCALPCGWYGINTKASFTAVYKAPVVDKEAPKVTVSAPDKVTTATVKVTGKATDNVGVVSVWIGAKQASLAPDGTFEAVLDLVPGDNTFTVSAYDAAGNVGTATLKVSYVVPQVTKIVLKIGSDIMTVNGKVVQLDAAPEIREGRTFLPLRAIAEAFGAQVTWVPETQGITVVLGNNQIGLQIGNNTAVVNGNVFSIVPPYIKNGRTMVPVRVIAEGLGAQVEWDPVNYIVTITMQG
ncbi:MAG: stalk domain-containing protein [Candidatus Parvarchaeota archaeon]|nr:stalk domain-containing protein [Candidatus Jingweiarchaeum tengchongense]